MKKRFIIIVGILLLFLMPLVSADTGPHQSATLYFNVTYNNSPISGDFGINLLACRQDGCTPDNAANCADGICEFHYYRVERVPSQMKLLIEINKEKFTSDIINFSWTKPTFFYDVNILPENKMIIGPSLNQEENAHFPFWTSFFLALILTIIIELAVLIIFLRKWKIKTRKWKKPIITLITANIISVPLVWIIFFLLVAILTILMTEFPWANIVISFIIAEAFAVVLEACFMYWLNKKIISLKRSFILSIVMNAASFVIGGIILAILLSLL